MAKAYDLAIIGGGLTGTAVARDAAGRGLSVFLCDEGDLGGGASGATNKLIHGGLGLLEGMRLGAMREAVVEREIAMHSAPHLLRPLRFLIPHHERQWSKAALHFGLYAFDRVAGTSLPPSKRVDLDAASDDGVLQSHFTVGFAYSDCVADDSRLVILNALDARGRGARIHPRTRCTVAEREGGAWRVSLESAATGEQQVVRAAVLINAAGAASADVHNHVVHSSRAIFVRLRKSVCIVVRREAPEAIGYALPNADGRIVFAFPWHDGTTLIGAAEGEASAVVPSVGVEKRDIAYLLDVARQYFNAPIWASDVAWSFAGVHAMPADGGRGNPVVIDAPPRMAPLVTVTGGTLTGHRRLAEQVVGQLARFRPMPPAWTAGAVLPGGGIPARGGADLVRALRAAYPFIAEAHAARLVRAYGTRASMILTGARSAADLGVRFGADLTKSEVDYLRTEEWASTAEDVLWRRSRLGLSFTMAEAEALAGWMEELPVAAAEPL